jgi:hypothetical protein
MKDDADDDADGVGDQHPRSGERRLKR